MGVYSDSSTGKIWGFYIFGDMVKKSDVLNGYIDFYGNRNVNDWFFVQTDILMQTEENEGVWVNQVIFRWRE